MYWHLHHQLSMQKGGSGHSGIPFVTDVGMYVVTLTTHIIFLGKGLALCMGYNIGCSQSKNDSSSYSHVCWNVCVTTYSPCSYELTITKPCTELTTHKTLIILYQPHAHTCMHVHTHTCTHTDILTY